MKPRWLALFLLCSTTLLQADAHPWFDTNLEREERIEALIQAMTLDEKAFQMLNDNPAIERLGVPAYSFWNEALHGVAKNGRATVFPQAIAMAATFDEHLMNRVASAISSEARAKFVIAQGMGNRSRFAGLTFWSPNINIFRDPRWGRGQETYGEDPYLTSRFGLAMVSGLQGDNPEHLKTAACAKHYAVHSGPEALRHEFNAEVSLKDLHETYLPAFKALVTEGHVEAVMSAYNRVNGVPASGSEWLLQDILRDEWNFNGHVVSDCWALEDFHKHHGVTANEVETAAWALKAGVDLNCGSVYAALPRAVELGLVDEELVDRRLRQLLRAKFRLGLFDPLLASPFNSIPASVINGEKHAELAHEAALKSIVLLQNRNGALPLSTDIRSIYVTGPFATSIEVLLGNYNGWSAQYTTFLEGITAAVSPGTTLNYNQGILPYRPNINTIDWTTGEAQAADAMVVVLGVDTAVEGEEGAAIASPSKGDRLSLALPEHQLAFLRKLRENNPKPIIVVLTGGSPFALQEVAELADAVLLAWYPGQEGGRALADILFGVVSPSGRLPITFPVSEEQLPPYESYSMASRTYRYMNEAPMYPFGFGLNYSDVRLESLELSDTNLAMSELYSGVDVRVTVRNTGQLAIDEVVQLYVSAPGAGEGQPLQSLKGFQRIALQPGESRLADFHLEQDAFQVFDSTGKAEITAGTYTITAANAAPVERSVALGAANPVHQTLTVK